MRNFIQFRLLALLAVAIAVPAKAAWHKASTEHFVIYADEQPDRLRQLATRLETFDAAVRMARTMSDPRLGDGNRVTIFVVPDLAAVRELKRGDDDRRVAGFYMPRYWGPIAVVPRRTGRDWSLDAETVFFHEYAHHLMFADLQGPVPTWLIEGFAEFMSTADIRKDGSVGLGGPAAHRANALLRPVRKVPLSAILDGRPMRADVERSALYARGWLLAHYLTFSPSRRGQIEAYLEALARGRPQLNAARETFGDIDKLDRELDAYLEANKFPYLTLPASGLSVGAISIEALGPGASAAAPLFMKVKVGVQPDQRPALAAEARRLAAAFSNDALVAMTLAEAELYNGNHALADAAADRAVALAPQSAEAMMLKGRALLGRARKGDRSVTFAAARAWFSRANRIDPEDPEPLAAFYRSYLEGGTVPTANAIEGLHYASDLAPFDMELRVMSARRYIADGKLAQARARLVPVAHNPHGGLLAATAAAMIARIDAGGNARANALRQSREN